LFIGNDENMEKLKCLINQVAPVDTTILISGETGVGKEVVSREIHTRSNRRDYPYIKVNCAAIPASLMESELFGYEKGAFTGADNKRKLGFFELANHGTILLDEIGEIPLPLQSKLLRVLQEKELTRLGDTKPVSIDIRIIAATNKDLLKEVNAGLFRKDLYYRLCVIPMVIPPLRERLSDIHILSNHFLDKFNRKYGMTKKISTGAQDLLKQYDWPGNVRELENIIERLIVISKNDIIDKTGISSVLQLEKIDGIQSILNNPECSLKDSVMILEKHLIEKALNDTGSSYKAAEKLGMNQSTIVRKAQKLGINNWRV
ncbi:MAG: Fis family transcriptional regulator, partial [bacterium]|nr:Fis family transcriptional regulator [bacterium]